MQIVLYCIALYRIVLYNLYCITNDQASRDGTVQLRVKDLLKVTRQQLSQRMKPVLCMLQEKHSNQ